MEEPRKYPIKIGKRFCIGVLFAVFGICFLIYGIVAYYKYEDAISFEELSSDNCKKGQYVSGKITTYVYDDLGKGAINGVSEEMVNMGAVSCVYTVYIKNGEMIRIVVGDLEKRKELDNILQAQEPITFEGEIVKATTNLNVNWYDNVGGVQIDDIIETYVVEEANIKGRINFVYAGFAFIVFAAVYLMLYCRYCRNGLIY